MRIGFNVFAMSEPLLIDPMIGIVNQKFTKKGFKEVYKSLFTPSEMKKILKSKPSKDNHVLIKYIGKTYIMVYKLK